MNAEVLTILSQVATVATPVALLFLGFMARNMSRQFQEYAKRTPTKVDDAIADAIVQTVDKVTKP